MKASERDKLDSKHKRLLDEAYMVLSGIKLEEMGDGEEKRLVFKARMNLLDCRNLIDDRRSQR